ncbi:uncharacterized protein si:ch211-139g16.8 isoform X2 [Pleuronectes platessa]|uniref:uncharacterized protein si:ch211-139g16.8 isoform X2 n=1 Tax=Pleuronectes platessa TaxID=8262 RepID=UPI00232A1A36|nr:uncharacterized protein si:ch211-139g16.8 isoform X2 [Pleuronectes platessa]
MRSPTSVQATDMDWLLCFSLMLTHLLLTDSLEKTEISLTQRQREIWRKTGQKVVLPCTVSPHSSANSFNYKWFVFKENSHFPLKLISPKYSLEGASLGIKPLNINDSGIYYCAAQRSGNPVNGSQHVGLGTALTVTRHVKTMTWHILLYSSFVLLVIYSTAIVTLIILKKLQHLLQKDGKNRQAKGINKENKIPQCAARNEQQNGLGQKRTRSRTKRCTS